MRDLLRRAGQALGLLGLCAAGLAQATAYKFPGNLPSGCSKSGANYMCASLTLSSSDSVTVTDTGAPFTINFSGNLTLGQSAGFNVNGNAAAATVNVSGTLSMAYQSTLNHAVVAQSLSLTNANLTFGGSLSSGTALTLPQASSVNGSVSASGAVSLGQDVVVTNNVSSTTSTVDIGYRNQISGNVSAKGNVTAGQNAVISGTVTSSTGAIDVGIMSRVTGTVSSTSGTIHFGQSAVASACVRSTGSAAITLDFQATVNSVCCGAGACGTACVVNNSSAAMPPRCFPTAIADYRFDACSYSGVSGEVKDSIGSNHATAILGATTGSGAPQVINPYGNLNDTDGRRYFAPVTAIALPSDWSVSTWLKFPLSTGGSPYRILGAMAGGGDILYMDGNTNFSWGAYTPGNVVAGTYQFGTLSSGWHHVAVVGQGSTTSLYVDGSFKESVNGKATGSLAFIGASYDSDAGTQEGMNTAIDEYLVFNTAISASDVSTIRTNQLAGKNYDGSSRAAVAACPVTVNNFSVSANTTASTCTPQVITVSARDAYNNVLTGYTGTVTLGTSTGRGDFAKGSGPTPAGTLAPGTANTGTASYTFVAADAGVIKLTLSHSLAQNLTVSVSDASVTGSASSSATIQFRDNVFVWSEDLASKIAGTNVVVAGRNHDMQVALWKKDPTTGNCGIATDYSGSRNLKLWRTDNGGPWMAPGIVNPVLTTVPATRPGSNNLSGLSFTAGVASLNLRSSDIGKYTLNLDDDSQTYAAAAVSGSIGDLTVRPFTLAISALKMGAVNNPAGSLASDAVFGAAGEPISATAGAYLWASGADGDGDGVPDAGASLATVTAGGLAPSFNNTINLSGVAGSYLPTTAGSVSGAFSTWSGGQASAAGFSYGEVGSFRLNSSALVSNFLGTTGLSLNGLVFKSDGTQNDRVGRFIPFGFKLSGTPALVNRVASSCSPASTFTYLGEAFQYNFTLNAVNRAGTTLANYSASYAKLDPSVAGVMNLAGIQGTTTLKGTKLGGFSNTGSWGAGTAAVTARALVNRAATPEGPFDTASFGIAPVDSDGVAMSAYDLDTDSPADGADHTLLTGSVKLRYGQLRLQNAIGSQTRDLKLPLLAQYWDGTTFLTHTLDSCTSVAASSINFGNYRKTLTTADSALKATTYSLSSGTTALTLKAPTAGRSGSFDVALSLLNVTDRSCLQNWTPGVTASTAASLGFLQGGWCGAGTPTFIKDPAARATFGLYKGTDSVVYQRENY